MRPIDNLRLLLEGQAPRWIPFSLDVGAAPGFSEPVLEEFRRRTGADDPREYFDADIRMFSLRSRFGGDDPAAWHERLEPGTTFDEWGIGHWAGGLPGTTDRTFPSLATARSVHDVEAFPAPIIETDADLAPLHRCHDAGYPVFGYAGSVYEWSWWIRGMQDFLMDLVSQPEMAESIIWKIAGHTKQLALASAAAGIDVLCFYDDAGTQRGMQIAPELWRRFIKPAWRDVLDSVRQEYPAARTFLHCCGKIDAIVPDIIDLGFDILHPLQPECMDFEGVYHEYGRDIVLTATISSQQIFPFRSPAEVRHEVQRLVQIVGEDRRAILMPSNVIQPETPWESVVAFADEAKRLQTR